MTSFRFIHTADIHLDSPLKGLAGYEGPAVERIRTATRQAFDNLIGEAIAQEVSFVVIAGDLYDGDWRDYNTGLFFARQMGRLAEAEIPAFVLHGNHDAESQITRRLNLPESVNVFPARKPETFTLKGLGVALHGQSFRQRDVVDNLVPAYPEPVSGVFNIGVLHTGMGGMGGHLNYAPCSLGELVAKGYDYWALGHVHQGNILNHNPHVVFPGNLQGRHIRETGPKGAYLVSVEENEIIDLDLLQTDVVRWIHLQVNIGGCDRNAEALERIQNAIEKAIASTADGRLLACRIELTGHTGIHDYLVVSIEHLLAEVRAIALGFGDAVVWVERVVVGTEPVVDPAVLTMREDAMGELCRMLKDAAADTELIGQVEADVSEFVRKLPSEVRREIEDPALKAAVQGDYPSLITYVQGFLKAHLTSQRF